MELLNFKKLFIVAAAASVITFALTVFLQSLFPQYFMEAKIAAIAIGAGLSILMYRNFFTAIVFFVVFAFMTAVFKYAGFLQ